MSTVILKQVRCVLMLKCHKYFTPSVSFCLMFEKKKTRLRKCIFTLYFPIIHFFWNILYSNFNPKKNSNFLYTLYISKKLKPSKKLKANRNKPIFFVFAFSKKKDYMKFSKKKYNKKII
jgi:hypothetical protein